MDTVKIVEGVKFQYIKLFKAHPHVELKPLCQVLAD